MQKVIACAVLTAFLVSGCGEEYQAESPSQPQVEYASSEAASVEIQNYMNADWLYDEYFGEYGFPDEFKATVINEIKLVANGFALQFARGEDVEQNIAEFRSGMLMLQVSGQFGAMISQMSEEWYSGDYEAMDAKPPEVARSLLPDAMLHGHESPEEHARLKALEESAAKDAAAFLNTQEELVEKYNLPYELPGRAPKYIIFSPSMKGGGWKGSNNDQDQKAEYKHESLIDTWMWYPGDIIWSDGGAGFGHMGIVTHFNETQSQTGNGHVPPGWRRPAGTQLSIIDANLGGVEEHRGTTRMQDWQNRYDTVRRYSTGHHYLQGSQYCAYYNTSCGGRFNDVLLRMSAIVDWARAQVGKPYNWAFFNKNADDAAYCSQLVWNAYKRTSRPWLSGPEWRYIDLDSNRGPIVFPNDILNHASIGMYRESKKVREAPCVLWCF